MQKFYLVPQPPKAEKFTFLVDDITDSGNWGTTNDLEKIAYNRSLFDEDINEDIEIRQSLTDVGTTSVFNFGKFIIILELKKGNSSGCMTFFDFQTDFSRSELIDILKETYSDNIIKGYLKCHDVLVNEFTAINDLAILHKPEL